MCLPKELTLSRHKAISSRLPAGAYTSLLRFTAVVTGRATAELMLSIEEGRDYVGVVKSQLPYILLENLGYGGSGYVEKVRDTTTNAVYARKIIPIPLSKSLKEGPRRVFRNEIKKIRSLGSHRHFVSVYATYEAEFEFGLVLQPVADGGDLEKYLANYWTTARDAKNAGVKNTCLASMVSVLEQAFGCLAAGMAYMHYKRVRHKDVKPRNILVHNGRVIYTDFGYSFDSNGRSRSATDGKPGPITRKYSAPEVLEHEQRDSSSDVYSLGCVFIDLLSALTLAMDPGEHDIHLFSASKDEVRRHIKSWDTTSQIASLPMLITRMTMHDPSQRLCAVHAASELFQTPGLSCSECASEPIDSKAECAKINSCVKGVKRPGQELFVASVGEQKTPNNDDAHQSRYSSTLRFNASDYGIVHLDIRMNPTPRGRALTQIFESPSTSFALRRANTVPIVQYNRGSGFLAPGGRHNSDFSAGFFAQPIGAFLANAQSDLGYQLQCLFRAAYGRHDAESLDSTCLLPCPHPEVS
jgi:serine/threonine protein kinase